MICNTIGLTTDSFSSIYMTGGAEVEEVYGAINYAQPIYAKTREMTGIPPLYFTSRTAGTLTDYRIYGETLQDGTPSPDYPVDVVGVGERTENLFDGSYLPYGIMATNGAITKSSNRFAFYIPVEPNTSYSISRIIGASTYFWYGFTDAVPTAGMRCVPFGDLGADATTNTVTNTNHKYLMFFFGGGESENVMLNTGSTALPYIPYGYKIPVTVSNGTDTITTPVYIGNEPLHRIGEYADYVDYASGKIVRKIKKLVLTGEENYFTYGIALDGYVTAYTRFIDAYNSGTLINQIVCNCLKPVQSGWAKLEESISHWKDSNYFITLANSRIGVVQTDSDSVKIQKLKAYLAAQYATGTPVTVWYILETPIEEDPPVPFSAIPTLSGTNTLSIDTTVQPSQIYIKGKIKPDGYGNLTDKNGVYILDKDGVQLTVHGQTDTPNA